MAALSDNDREFLTYALDVAEEWMVRRREEFTPDDDVSLARLRHVATCQECADTIEFCGQEGSDD